MNYNETIAFLFSQLPVFQRQGKKAYKANLDTTIALDTYFKNPHKHYSTIHIAGTNGKGSVSHMLASVLQEAGYKTGLYTSPHLKDFRERIKINGAMIPEQYVTSFVNQHIKSIESLHPSFFELTVAMAFQYFYEEEVDIAVIETGLGGRLDSTNIITPLVSVITNISLDHTDLLGKTITDIAIEKAGIIKSNIPVIIGEYTSETKEIFDLYAKNKQAPIYYTNQQSEHLYSCDLKGSYQTKNIQTCIQTLLVLQNQLTIKDVHIKNGLEAVIKNTGLQGRWQQLDSCPKIICDTGHNEAGINLIIDQLVNEDYKQLHIVWGMVKDKDVQKIVSLLPGHAKYYISNPNIERALPVDELAKVFSEKKLSFKKFSSLSDALLSAKEHADCEDLIFIGGSTFSVAEII